jgi:hypothetical protein
VVKIEIHTLVVAVGEAFFARAHAVNAFGVRPAFIATLTAVVIVSLQISANVVAKNRTTWARTIITTPQENEWKYNEQSYNG